MSGPAISSAHSLVVAATGAMVGAVQQPAELTRFAFENRLQASDEDHESNTPPMHQQGLT